MSTVEKPAAKDLLSHGHKKCNQCGGVKPGRWFESYDGNFGLCKVCHELNKEKKAMKVTPVERKGKQKNPMPPPAVKEKPVVLSSEEKEKCKGLGDRGAMCERCGKAVDTSKLPWYAGACMHCWKPQEVPSFAKEWSRHKQSLAATRALSTLRGR